jgi:energy-coupling factor transporter ATP-binding protein EcfA2
MDIIKINNLSFKYPQQSLHALDNINLSVKKGQFIGITGPTGAGKSTLALCINGVIPHIQKGKLDGYVYINGDDILNLKFTHLSKKIGSVFQDPESQIVSTQVDEEIAFGLENLGIPYELMEKRIAMALEMTGIPSLRHRSIETLSGGQKQRVAAASVLAMMPEIIVLDEPTSELDPTGTMEIFNLLKKMSKEMNLTIILIEQKVNLLAQYCDNLIIMNKGKIALNNTPENVFANIDYLKKIGVKIPQLTDLAQKLNIDEIPLELSQSQKIFERYLKERECL